MKGIILAAGRGSRMNHLTENRPKCLLKFRSIPLLNHQLNAFKESGIKEVALVTGYKREMFSKYNLFQFHNDRWADTQMLYSLTCASDWLEKYDCVISYSDIFYESSAIRSLCNSQSDISLTYDPDWLSLWTKRFDNPLLDAETFRVANNRLLEIGGKASSTDEIMGQYMGLLRFSPAGWRLVTNYLQKLPTNLANRMDITNLLSKLIKNNYNEICAIPYYDSWGEVDHQSDLDLYESLYK